MKKFIIFFIIFIFPMITYATVCPQDKPIQDIKGSCYSCFDNTDFIKSTLNEPSDYIGDCEKLCPNRIEYTDGWLDPIHYCVINTFKNRFLSHIIPNMIFFILPPFWINLLIFVYFIKKIFNINIRKSFILPCVSILLGLILNIIYTLFALQYNLGFLCYLVMLPIIFGLYRIVYLLRHNERQGLIKEIKDFIKKIIITLFILFLVLCVLFNLN